MAINWQSNGNEVKAYNHALSEADIQEISKLLASLDASDICGSVKTIHPADHDTSKKDGWRVDLQSPSTDAYNVQVQKNGAPNPSSVGGVMVPMHLVNAIGQLHGVGKDTNAAARKRAEELRYAVHGALVRSARTLSAKTTGRGAVIPGQFVITMQKVVGQYSH
jgi:hypothetical protein